MRPVRDTAEWSALLAARHDTYAREGKSAPPDDERLDDPTLHVLMAEVAGAPVASLSIRVAEASSARFAWLPPEAQPALAFEAGVLPAPSAALEIGRLFVLPEHRSKRLSVALFQGVHRLLRAAQRDFIVIASTSALQPSYRALCFEPTGLRFTKDQLGAPQELEVMVARHRQLGAYGLAAGPLRWCLYMQPIVDELTAGHLDALSWRERWLYRAYAPFRRLAWAAFGRR